MDTSSFTDERLGHLVPISGTDVNHGAWQHQAFVPFPLPAASPTLTPRTYLAVANARAALAALDSTARRLPNPRLLRRPTLRAEAQSTSALEGTYEPLAKVLAASTETTEPGLREVINYEVMAEHAFALIERGEQLTVPALCEMQRTLVRGTRMEQASSGRVRTTQVVIGRRRDAPPGAAMVHAARFIPPPPGLDLEASLRDLLAWIATPRRDTVDPVVAAALAHYQFETLHPFHDGNGRIGRLLIVVQLHLLEVLSEPTLTVSPWFEARRSEYEDRLHAVSTRGEWNQWVDFFARGIGGSAVATHRKVSDLVEVQLELKEVIKRSALRADTAHSLVDLAVAQIIFTARDVERELEISYGRANTLISSLVSLGILTNMPGQARNRHFYAPRVFEVLLRAEEA